MNKKIFVITFLATACAPLALFSADNPPSEASVKRLLEVSEVRKIIDDTANRIDQMVVTTMERMMRGQNVTPKMQREIEQGRDESKAIVKEMLDWSKLEPMYIRIYQKSFNQDDVNNLIAMYQTPGGKALLAKMPEVMQNSMAEMQNMMQPMLERVQKKQQDLAAKIQAEQKGG